MTLFLKETQIETLPNNFHYTGTLDCSGSSLKNLPEGLKVEGDLILKDSNIQELPKLFTVYGNLYLNEKILKVSSQSAVIGGKVFDFQEKEVSYSPPSANIIITDDGYKIISTHKRKINTPSVQAPEYALPVMTFYKGCGTSCAVQYIDEYNGQQYTYMCEDIHDAIRVVAYARAKLIGYDKIKNYDIYTLRTVGELKEIYYICTRACSDGIKKFLNKKVENKEKLYSIEELWYLLENYPQSQSAIVFKETFNPKTKGAL